MTEHEVFIIESLRINDLQFGNLFAENLRCSGKRPIYMSVKNEDELRKSLKVFKASKYRYLFIICHGNGDYLFLNNSNSINPEKDKESINYETFLSCFPDGLEGFRLFLAACELGNIKFSNTLMKERKCIYSIAAPEKEIQSTQALYVWTTFFNQLFSDFNNSSLKSNQLIEYLQKALSIFQNVFHVSLQKTKDRKISHYHVAATDNKKELSPYEETSWNEC